jgi:hypothetical protein
VQLEEASAAVNQPKFTGGRLWRGHVIRPEPTYNQTLLGVTFLP